MKRLVIAVFILLLFSPALVLAKPPHVVIQALDSLQITVHGHNELKTVTRVSENGEILFPYIGKVKIAGLSPISASQKIAYLLRKKKILKKPNISILLLKTMTNEITILGEVHRPGKYSLTNYNVSNILDIIALAGGRLPLASNNAIIIKHTNPPKRIKVNIDQLVQEECPCFINNQLYKISPGDTIYIPKQEVFYIYGHVVKPGAYAYKRGMIAAQAIAIGGGVREKGTLRGLSLERKNAKGELEHHSINLADPLYPNDIIFVEESIL